MARDSKRRRHAPAKIRSLRRRRAAARRRARRVVLPTQWVEWDIKIEARHYGNIDWLLLKIEREIEKSARGESWGCYKYAKVKVGVQNTMRNWVDKDMLTEWDWEVTEKTHDTLKIFLIGPIFKRHLGDWHFIDLNEGFNHKVKSRIVVKYWGASLNPWQMGIL